MNDPTKRGNSPELTLHLPWHYKLTITADDQSAWACTHRWTLSRHLWEADSSFEFARMWKEKPHFIIANYSFEHFIQCGRGEDVDDFAEILLSV